MDSNYEALVFRVKEAIWRTHQVVGRIRSTTLQDELRFAAFKGDVWLDLKPLIRTKSDDLHQANSQSDQNNAYREPSGLAREAPVTALARGAIERGLPTAARDQLGFAV